MLTIGARTSPLARAQADLVAAELAAHGVATTYVPTTTSGDTDRRHLTEIGGTGVFVAAVRDRLLSGVVDLAVHSAKDLPTAPTPGLHIGAVPERADVRDVLVGTTGARLTSADRTLRIGTGSPRRAVQLRDWARRLDAEVEIVAIRGNVDTRLRLVVDHDVDAVVLAAAGLSRLGRIGLDKDTASWLDGPDIPDGLHELPLDLLDTSVMLPAAAQGALAVETLADARPEVIDACGLLDRADRHAEIVAERAFLATIEAGCLAPVGVAARVETGRGTSADLTMAAVIGRTAGGSVDMSTAPGRLIRLTARGSMAAAAEVGRGLAQRVLDGSEPG